jgi:hypothetical protein
MKKTLLFISLIGLLWSCSSPLDKKFSKETSEKDIKEIKTELDSTELMLLAGSMIRLQMTGEKLEGMTYREILDNGKKWKAEQEKIEAEQKSLAEKAKKEEEARIKKLTESVLVSCYSKSFAEYDYQEYITYKFVIQNKSDKGIRAVKGSISFTNLFDEEIKSLSFVYDQPIAAGKEVTWNAQTDYNQFMDDDVALKNKDLKDLKDVWKPEKIIFEDGTTLE